MKYVDRFDKPTHAWVRGLLTPSEKPGPVRIGVDSFVTLSGCAVHPESFGHFDARWVFGFRSDARYKDETAFVCIGFGKPFELSGLSESQVVVRIAASGDCLLLGPDEKVLKEFRLAVSPEGFFTLEMGNRDGVFHARTADGMIELSGVRTAGFMMLQTSKAPLLFHAFDFESPDAIPPFTLEQRKQNECAWKDAKVRQARDQVEKVRQYLSGKSLARRTALKVYPGLVNVGEKVTVTFRATQDPASSRATLELNYLGAEPGRPVALALDWRRDADGGFVAETSVSAQRPGNHRVILEADGERLARVIGVVEPGYTVCSLWIGSNKPKIDREIHKYDLPGDYWVCHSLFFDSAEETVENFRFFADIERRYGDNLFPVTNANMLLGIKAPNQNLMDLEERYQDAMLKAMKDLWDVLGLEPLRFIASYTMNNATIRILKKHGIKALNSYCVWQNWLDGVDDNAWRINHWATPNAPFYIADDDFRKAASERTLLGFGMGTATSVRNYFINYMEGCPSICVPAQRYNYRGVLPFNVHRFYWTVDGWCHDGRNNDGPAFVSIGIENFVGKEEWAEANRLGLEYLVGKAKTEKLVFSNTDSICDYYLAHYDRQPEQVLYQPDVYAGYRIGPKPARIQDRIEINNHRFHALHVENEALPQFLWDYTREWHEPEWLEQKELRGQYNSIAPESLGDKETAPRQVDRKGLSVNAAIKSVADGVHLEISLDSPREYADLPLAVWNIPLDPRGAALSNQSGTLRWIAVEDGFTGNLHGVVVCTDVPAGKSTWTVSLKGPSRAPVSRDFEIEKQAAGRMVVRDGGTHAYVWPNDSAKTVELEIGVEDGQQVQVQYVDGTIVKAANGRLRIACDTTWQKENAYVSGATRQQLATMKVVQTESGAGPGTGKS